MNHEEHLAYKAAFAERSTGRASGCGHETECPPALSVPDVLVVCPACGGYNEWHYCHYCCPSCGHGA